jgi:hypothetical protein
MEDLKKFIKVIWTEKDHISCKVEYTGPKSYTIESLSLEYQDSHTDEKKQIELSGPKNSSDRFVTTIIYMPLCSGNVILNGKITIGITNSSNERKELVVQILD